MTTPTCGIIVIRIGIGVNAPPPPPPPPLQLEELLGLSERLQSTLTTLSKEKDLLECSLRQEVASNHQLTLEKAGMGEREGGREGREGGRDEGREWGKGGEGEGGSGGGKGARAGASGWFMSLLFSAPGLAEQVEEVEASLARTREELAQLQVHPVTIVTP